jgi:4-hydroxy-tetrahydrodipicolinate synthase
MHDQEEMSMMTETTRRTFLGAVVAAAAMAAPRGNKTQGASTEKCLFWVAACTPCDKNLKFDEAYYRDMMAYFKDQGADGVVVTGTTGEYPSFSTVERKKIQETALKHRAGLTSMIVSTGTC